MKILIEWNNNKTLVNFFFKLVQLGSFKVSCKKKKL